MAPRQSEIAKRGVDAAAAPAVYFASVMKLQTRLWSPQDPDGNIVMSIAENRLTVDLIKEKMQCQHHLPDSVFFYDNMTGSDRLKAAMLTLVHGTFMQGLALQPKNLTISSGCGAIINNLIYCITEPGEGVALPAPYYPAFDYDIRCKNDGVPVPVYLSASEESYDQQLQRAADEHLRITGKRLAVLLVTNPDNPTGTAYSKQHLLQMLTWCVTNKVHLISILYARISCLRRAFSLSQRAGQGHKGTGTLCRRSDEIYANSIFKPDSQFTSLAVLASKPQEHGLCPEDVRSYIHVMFGLSKDWCASGLRVGCLWTLNAPVQNAMQNLSYFCAVSGVAQHILADLLDDTAFVKKYLKENLRRLGAAYDTLTGALTRAGIKFTPAVAGVFCWVDLRSALPEATWEAERQLWEEGFVQRCGFIITPGNSCHAAEPGFFRICYAIVDNDTILQLVDRLVSFISKSHAERQNMPLWITRASMQKVQQQIKNDPAQPEVPVQH